jgi:hypothetical protein
VGVNGRDIELHIEDIFLASMPAGGERRLREAVEREMARLARQSGGEKGWSTSPGERGSSRPHDGSGGRSSEAVAARVGRGVQAGIARAPQR